MARIDAAASNELIKEFERWRNILEPLQADDNRGAP
jgi:hypothetical protein